jgi:hypothetical protein
MDYGRRQFLTGTGCGLLTAIMSPSEPIAAELEAESESTLVLARKIIAWSSEISAGVVGREFLRTSGASVTLRHSVKELLPTKADQNQFIRNDDRASWISLIKMRVSQDFKNGNIVKLHGWVLAKTEIDICVVSALVENAMHDGQSVSG